MSNLLPEGAGIVVGVGVGAAASAAIEPAVEIPKQEAWDRNRNKILAASLMAALVAQGAIELSTGENSAHREGYDDDKFKHLVYLAQTAAGASEALELWRKGFIDADLYRHALTKAARDPRYVFTGDSYRLKELVGLGDIGYAVVRGILPTPSWVPVAPPASGDKVPRFPQVQLDPVRLAEQLGFDEDMLRIIVGRSGLSMAPIMAANARFRNIIGPNDYLLAIAEGDLRTEWAEAVLETARQIPTGGQMVEAQLRGMYGRADRLAQTARHGYTDADSDLLYYITGRGISPHAVTTGLARGGKFPGSYDNVPEPWKSAIERANTVEAFAELAYANRYSYPSGFQIKSEAAEIGYTDTKQILLEVGWSPKWADFFAQKWSGGKTTAPTVSPAVKTEQTRLKTAAHRSYVGSMVDSAAATSALEAAGIAAADVTEILRLWDAERALIRATLSPADIRKGYQKADVNAATGVPWTRDEALAALLDRGWAMDTANQYLDIG